MNNIKTPYSLRKFTWIANSEATHLVLRCQNIKRRMITTHSFYVPSSLQYNNRVCKSMFVRLVNHTIYPSKQSWSSTIKVHREKKGVWVLLANLNNGDSPPLRYISISFRYSLNKGDLHKLTKSMLKTLLYYFRNTFWLEKVSAVHVCMGFHNF